MDINNKFKSLNECFKFFNSKIYSPKIFSTHVIQSFIQSQVNRCLCPISPCFLDQSYWRQKEKKDRICQEMSVDFSYNNTWVKCIHCDVINTTCCKKYISGDHVKMCGRVLLVFTNVKLNTILPPKNWYYFLFTRGQLGIETLIWYNANNKSNTTGASCVLSQHTSKVHSSNDPT